MIDASATRTTRRQWLQTSVTGLAAVGLGLGGRLVHATQVEPARATGPQFRKAVKIGMVDVPGSLADKFRLLRELGFDGVELDSPGGPSADEVQQAIADTGLVVHGVVDSAHWNQPLSHPDPEVRAQGYRALVEAIEMSRAYGGTSVLLVPAVCNDQVSYEVAWERSTPEIAKALAVAEEHSIDILLENVWNDFLTDPHETARYVDQFNHARIGAYYDVGNSVRFARPVEWVRVLGARIKKLDIKEYDLVKAKAEGWWKGFDAELLDGTCDWPDVMKELRRIGFSGWGTAEIPGGGRDRLADIASRMDRIFAS
jgi:hexulose-6-phosphate isomerase